MLRVGDLSRRVVNRWYEIAFEDSGAALTEDVDHGEFVREGFREHRHDQAILTHVLFSENVPVLERDESQHNPWEKGEEFPFLAMRNKTGVSRLDKIFRRSRRRKFFRQVFSRLSFGYLFSVISKRYPLDRKKLCKLFKIQS